MSYGDRWKTTILIEVTVDAPSKERAAYRWDNTLEKIKYQMSNVHIEQKLLPDWNLIEEFDGLEQTQSDG